MFLKFKPKPKTNNFLFFQFSRLDSHAKMIKKNPKIRDFTSNFLIKAKIDQKKKQFNSDLKIDGLKLISEALQKQKEEIKLGK